MIQIMLTSIFVDDQEKALRFYTEKIGFVKVNDEPVGEFRWLTIAAKDSDFEMALEPDAHPAAKAYQKAIFDDGIPATMLFVDNLDFEFKRLKEIGVKFKSEPQKVKGSRLATFNDTCGNWIMLCQKN